MTTTKMTTTKRELIQVLVEPDLAAWLKTQAKRRGLKVSPFVRMLLLVAQGKIKMATAADEVRRG